jgi:hypothetical protein
VRARWRRRRWRRRAGSDPLHAAPPRGSRRSQSWPAQLQGPLPAASAKQAARCVRRDACEGHALLRLGDARRGALSVSTHAPSRALRAPRRRSARSGASRHSHLRRVETSSLRRRRRSHELPSRRVVHLAFSCCASSPFFAHAAAALPARAPSDAGGCRTAAARARTPWRVARSGGCGRYVPFRILLRSLFVSSPPAQRPLLHARAPSCVLLWRAPCEQPARAESARSSLRPLRSSRARGR